MNIAIIGAGAAGLATAKFRHLPTITVFEALPSLAGVWASHASAVPTDLRGTQDEHSH